MTQLLLFLGFSLIATGALFGVKLNKKIKFNIMMGLFLFGILLSVPFILVEHLAFGVKFYLVMLAFVAIEALLILMERRVKFFHDLIHHNVKDLRIISFILIGLGFTYSEISVSILGGSDNMTELINTIPFKTTYALLMHTVFAYAASLIQVGEALVESVIGTLIKMVTYYIRIGIISVSHFLYIFSIEHNLMFLISIMLAVGIGAFFYIKKHLDTKLIYID